MVCTYRETSGAVPTNRPFSLSFMPTTRTIKGVYTSNISNSGSSTSSLASSAQSDISMSAQPALSPNTSCGTAWESASESPNDSESLPPRLRLKKKRSEFRIIKEPPSQQDHTTEQTELKPIPNPPWANDSFSQDSSHRDATRGKRTLGPQQNCTYGRKSFAECSARTVHDEVEHDIVAASAVIRQFQHSGTETNSFPPPARPSRKQKRYACDLCGQIFTRSGDVRRHKESRHDNSEGCRCPFCDRVLTR